MARSGERTTRGSGWGSDHDRSGSGRSEASLIGLMGDPDRECLRIPRKHSRSSRAGARLGPKTLQTRTRRLAYLQQNDKAVLVYSTFPSLEAAEAEGAKLVEQGLAACVNILPGMVSIYVWEGKGPRDAE